MRSLSRKRATEGDVQVAADLGGGNQLAEYRQFNEQNLAAVAAGSYALCEVAQQEARHERHIEPSGGLGGGDQLAQACLIAARRCKQQQPRQVTRIVEALLCDLCASKGRELQRGSMEMTYCQARRQQQQQPQQATCVV